MQIRDIASFIESWAPPSIAWDRDNVGLLVGSPARRVRRVLVALDATAAVVREAAAMKTDLIVTHHPLIFRPMARINGDERTGSLIVELVKRGIALYAAHTNLDFTAGGVSAVLAERLGLGNIVPLAPLRNTRRKIVVFVPASHAGGVMQSMAEAGAGVIGDYESCSFTSAGEGSFLPGPGSKPYSGRRGRLERVKELRLEMETPEWRLPQVLRAMRSAHPYDEVAYDVYPLQKEDDRLGMGALGNYPKALGLRAFLGKVARTLKARGVRYSGKPRSGIRKVAVCGGSGSDLTQAAVDAGADAFVTADVKYHGFQEHEGKIVLIDAGHYETEHPAVATMARYLRSRPALRRDRVRIYESKKGINPVNYFRS